MRAPHQTSMKLNNISAVLFDFGDTLVTLPIPREELFTRAAKSIGLELSIEAVRRAYQMVDFHKKYSSIKSQIRSQFYAEYNQLLCEALGIVTYYERLLPAVNKEFADKKWVLIDDVGEVLRELKRAGLPLGLVANWDSNLGDVAAQLQIRELFSVVIASQTVGYEKPDPEIFRLAVKQLGLDTPLEKILYVGNEYKADVMGARAASLTPVLIDRGNQYPNADCLRFDSLQDWAADMLLNS